MDRNSERRSGRDRRNQVTLGRARGWIALVGMIVAGGGGAQLGSQHTEASLSQKTADTLIHARDREVDAVRADVKELRDDTTHGFDRIERQLERLQDQRPR